MKLSTIQKRNNLNEVHRQGEQGPGGAHHEYAIVMARDVSIVRFQKGPRGMSTSVEGVLDGDLLEIVRDRLTSFQKGDYACRENAIALTKIEEALLWMAKRADDRAERNVLGTTQK